MLNLSKVINQFYCKVTKPLPGGDGAIYSIDFLRGIASIAILLVHYKHFFMFAGMNIDEVKNVAFFDVWSGVYSYGSNAVQLFWLISGFIFIHVYGSRQSETWKSFLVSRLARLYPLHILTLIFVLVVQTYSFKEFGHYNIYNINDVYHFMLNVFFASEWGLQEGRSFNGPIWSVSVEIFSYIMFFCVLKYIRLTFISLATVILISLCLYFFSKSLVLLCLVYFFCGALAYGIMSKISAIKMMLCSVLLFFITLYGNVNFEFIPKLMIYIPMFSTFLIMLTLLEKQHWFKFLNSPFISWVGHTSYGNYLWHSPLQMLFLVLVSLQVISINIIFEAYFIIMYIAITCAVSLLSFYYFELPMQRKIKTLCR